MSIFDIIKTLAKEQGKNVKEVALELGFGENLFYKWKTQSPTTDKLQKVADYFNVSTDFLLGRTTERRNSTKDINIYQEFKNRDEIDAFIKEISTTDKETLKQLIEIYNVIKKAPKN